MGGALRLDRLQLGVWGLCGWLVVGCVCWRRDGALVGDLACGAGASVCGGRWIVLALCAASTRPLSDFLFCCGDFSGGGPVF